MTENIKKLLELASDNEELKNKLNNASKDEIIAIAKEHGVTLTDADFAQGDEVSDDELNAVAGGRECDCPGAGYGGGCSDRGYRTCSCSLAGIGTWDNNHARCYCYQGGFGKE